MEELLVLAILLYGEIVTEDEYNKRLDELFLENLENEDLLYLEWETDIKRAIIYLRTHIDYNAIDGEQFGKILMDRLKVYYKNCADIESFASRMFSLWESLPGNIQDREPFFALSYADEPLSWGDEKQSRDIYEKMLNYYKEKTHVHYNGCKSFLGGKTVIVKWKPRWYELDQSIVVGDVDLFYLSKDNLYFANGFAADNDCEVKAKILNINHLELGDIKGIITIGLDYSIYLSDGNIIIVNAEESPGDIENSKHVVREWEFDVQINIIEKTGLSSKERLEMLSTNKRKEYQQECIKRYKLLLDLTKADWDC